MQIVVGRTIPRRHQKEHRTDSLSGRAVGGTLLDQRITPLLLEVEVRTSHPRAKTDITSIPRKVLKKTPPCKCREGRMRSGSAQHEAKMVTPTYADLLLQLAIMLDPRAKLASLL